LFLMPQITSLHHWILGTPFQYAAVILALAGLSEDVEMRARRLPQVLLVATAVALIAVRLPNLVAVEQSLAAGKSSERFDPEFTRVAELSLARSAEAVFVSGDWGSATQLYCVGNGRPGFVYAPYWSLLPPASGL